jgi:hypothetical protein
MTKTLGVGWLLADGRQSPTSARKQHAAMHEKVAIPTPDHAQLVDQYTGPPEI